jgi:hypothetical protein
LIDQVLQRFFPRDMTAKRHGLAAGSANDVDHLFASLDLST